jgi:ribosome-associated translation inhibitor RaiA
MTADTEIDVTADLSCINSVDWDEVSVKLDGTVITADGDELNLDDVLAAFTAVYHKLKRMVAIAKGEDE